MGPTLTMPIGVVVGMAAEARIARRLGWPVAIGGGTKAGAEAAVRTLLEDGLISLVSLGLAGGLDPSLPPGTVIVPGSVLDGHEHFPTDPELSRWLGGPTSQRLLGLDAIAADTAHKRRLWRETGAAAVDLESGAVARIASSNGLPFAVLRVICDPAERSLPPAALVALDSRGAIGIQRMLASIIAHPGQLSALLRLAVDAAVAKRSLLAHVKRIAPPRA
jgi:adenosylhomocysteine nucleosidase